MFTDERTQVKIYADPDRSVIYGTMRNCDLIPAFMDVIVDTPEFQQLWLTPTYQRVCNLLTDGVGHCQSEEWETDEICEFLIELFDVLDGYAPEGYYFGANPGDGSDYGYWEYCE